MVFLRNALLAATTWCFFIQQTDAGVKGFGIVFSVEPMMGSCGGGAELHIAGSGFSYATQVLINGRPCKIFEPSLKDGELTCYSPPNDAGWYEVSVVYTSGHVAYLRGAKFRYHGRYTPIVNYISAASPVQGNVTFWGDLKRVLESNQREMLEATGEKRNATEIMHAYLGPGLEVMADKGGLNEFRCDLIETPTINKGICEVGAGTPAGYYNFTYVLEDGLSGHGYGKAMDKL
ncbi:unnamed protein product [Polarella glacialis]|uniref:IPT/TIG domain-containing protein n=1 Tax=Polarella glacialis TaxID=89957 RepID=A0A813HS19_POLGL|nr:unnamed protein product [Polarella glacialis]